MKLGDKVLHVNRDRKAMEIVEAQVSAMVSSVKLKEPRNQKKNQTMPTTRNQFFFFLEREREEKRRLWVLPPLPRQCDVNY